MWMFEFSYRVRISLFFYLGASWYKRVNGIENISRTSENTMRSRLLPSGLNLTTLAASFPLVELPIRKSPVTGSIRLGYPSRSDSPPSESVSTRANRRSSLLVKEGDKGTL